MSGPDTRFSVRQYRQADDNGWVRCRALSFLATQYFDDVKPTRTVLTEPALALVAVLEDDQTVIGILDIEIAGSAATIDTIATHPDHQSNGVGTALLRVALRRLIALDVTTLDAWTREDMAANTWYQRNGFEEHYRYLHVHLGPEDDHDGFTAPAGLSAPVTAFMHADLADEIPLRSRFARTYVCRQYIRPVSPPITDYPQKYDVSHSCWRDTDRCGGPDVLVHFGCGEYRTGRSGTPCG